MKFIQLILMTGLFLPLASAQQQPPPPSEGQQSQRAAGGMASVEEHVKILTEKLNLTVDQLGKIKPILENQITQMQAVRKDSSLSPGQRLDKIRSIRDEAQAKIREVLTDAQKKKFDEMQTEMHEKMRQRPPSGGENPPPKPN